MTIETKFNVGDKIFVPWKNYILEREINEIFIQVYDSIHVWYYIDIPDGFSVKYREDMCYASREDIIHKFYGSHYNEKIIELLD